MTTGTGTPTLQSIPTSPFRINPAEFFAKTDKEVFTPKTMTHPAQSQSWTTALLQAGIIGRLEIKFVGTLVVTTAAVTTSSSWPYNLMNNFTLSANGQNLLWNCSGIDLTALRHIRFPSYSELVDNFPGTVGGGDSVATGTYNVELTYEVPLSMDDATLIGALYAQSGTTNLQLTGTIAGNSELFSANPNNAAITGTWYIQETIFSIPQDTQNGELIIPDLTKLHGFTAVETGYSNTGSVRTPLVKQSGNLERLLVSVTRSTGNRLSAMPNASSSNKIDSIQLEYGGNKRPYDISPASYLLNLNNQHYGAPAPYDRLVLDFVRENPLRDAILLAGVTELAIVPKVNSGVTIGNGANVRSVQETLY
jgi:hypothetical protein